MTVQKAALLGKELSHSISDVLHRELAKIVAPRLAITPAALEYELIECEDIRAFSSWIVTAAARGYLGANVTYPYKNELYATCERHVGASGAIGSGNVVRYIHGEPECASTDGLGFINALLRDYPAFDLEPYHLVVLGDGAAAKAVTYALCTKWMPLSLTIVSRSATSAKTLAEFCIAEAPGPTVRVMSINDATSNFPESMHRMVIQATSVGQVNHPGNLFAGFVWSELDFAVDLVYHPIQTSFLQAAAEVGAKTMNGLGMLIEQAALSQVFWYSGLLPASSPLSEIEYRGLLTMMTNLLR